MKWYRALITLIGWIDAFLRGKAKAEREERNEEIKSDPVGAFGSKFVRKSSDTELHSNQAEPDLDGNPNKHND